MTRYLTIRLTEAQAQTALNACDLIRDSNEASGDLREAAQYRRACVAIERVLSSRAARTPRPAGVALPPPRGSGTSRTPSSRSGS